MTIRIHISGHKALTYLRLSLNVLPVKKLAYFKIELGISANTVNN